MVRARVGVVGLIALVAMCSSPGGSWAAPASGPARAPSPARTEATPRTGDGGFTGLDTARGVAVDRLGNTYVADTLNNRVVMVPAGGGAQVTLPFTDLNKPYGVAVDSSGSVFVADTDNDRVVKLPAGGGPQESLNSFGLLNPYGVAVDGSGNVWIADTDNDRVVVSLGGSIFTKVFSGFHAPGGIAVDRNGAAYVADTGSNQVFKIRSTTDSPELLPFGPLSLPASVAVDGAGQLFVADSGNNRIVQAAFNATSQSVLPISGLSSPLGVAVDELGNVVVADSGHSKIVRYTRPLGTLRVVTSPAVASELIVDGVSRDVWSLEWVDLPTGSHQLCHGDVPGFSKPPCRDVDIVEGVTTTVISDYTARGYLRVLVDPPVPAPVLVDGIVRNNYGLWAEWPVGPVNVCFGPRANAATPACRSVTVTGGATATTTGVYTFSAGVPGPGVSGALRVTTSPPVPAKITVDDWATNDWGLDWMDVSSGPNISHKVCFGPVPNMIAPPCQTVATPNVYAVSVVGVYVPKGFLRVVTNPSVPGPIYVDGVAANAYGIWAPKAAGTYTVCFGPEPGFTPPPCQTATVTGGSTTTVTGTYATAP